jgi:NNP family nitrate/nitrite transporter-like MFS transporter
MGVLTDRYGARVTFPALMGFTALPLLAIVVWHASFASLIGFGFLLGFAGSSFAIGVPYVSRWYSKERQGFALGVYQINIVLAAAVMGVVSVGMSLIGLELGSRLGARVEAWSEEIGGGVLILLGIALGAGVLK